MITILKKVHSILIKFNKTYIFTLFINNETLYIIDHGNILTSFLPNYFNIKVRGKWDKRKIQQKGFIGRKLDENMVSDLSWAYRNYFGSQAAIAHYNIDFYQNLSFTIVDDDMVIEDVKLKVDDVVEIEGKDDDSDIEEKWFARIQAILVHQSNDDKHHIFLLFEWFNFIGSDSTMQCDRYLLQRHNENWKQIHPISIVNSHQKVHFVHDCSASCTVRDHDVNNRYYFKNSFLFNAV